MPGPAKKRSSLKVISGTERKDRAEPPGVDLPTISSVPDAPDWLPNPHAIKEWERLAPILVANKLLTEGGISALGVLCSLHGELVDLWSRRITPTGHMLAQYRALINDFGLTPVAQGKVKPVGKETDANPFGRNGKRPSAA